VNNLDVAKEYLQKGYSVCLCKEDDLVLSEGKGIAFIAFLAHQKRKFCDYSVADKIVGKAAALVYTLIGVKEIYATVMTIDAKDVLARAGIEATYGQLVNEIINRKGDGICPMEEAVAEISDAEVALDAIFQKMEKLKRGED